MTPNRYWLVVLCACSWPQPSGRVQEWPAACASGAGAVVPGHDPRIDATFRVALATGAVTRLGDDAFPLPGRPDAHVDNGRLIVDEGYRHVLDADAHGAQGITWQLADDDILIIALHHRFGQTYQALRISAVPALDTLWCRDADREGSRDVVATSSDMFIVNTRDELVAARTRTGEELWRVDWHDSGAPFTLQEAGGMWIACEHNVVAIARDTGQVRWRHPAPADVACDCAVVDNRVTIAPRRCGKHDCTPLDPVTLDLATGAVVSAPATPGTVAPHPSPSDPLRIGNHMLSTRADLTTGVASLDIVDVATGAKRVIDLPAIPSRMGAYELGAATIVGHSQDAVDIAVAFGFYE